MAIEAFDLILVALFAGVGTGIGNPIGQEIYKKIIRKHMKRVVRTAKSVVNTSKDVYFGNGKA